MTYKVKLNTDTNFKPDVAENNFITYSFHFSQGYDVLWKDGINIKLILAKDVVTIYKLNQSVEIYANREINCVAKVREDIQSALNQYSCRYASNKTE